jgi:division protein CdvB (Snf7/Vps24/ESCRT-III family)
LFCKRRGEGNIPSTQSVLHGYTMRAVVVCVLLCACFASGNTVHLRLKGGLPPGYNSANELATVLANEPDAARFASASFGSDTISFKDDGPSGGGGGGGVGGGSHGGGGGGGGDEGDADVAEFDAQIEQIDQDTKKLKEAIKESEEYARRLSEQNAEMRSLQEQRDHLEKEKEKRILQAKLEKQMRDLAEINRMSRSLRTKFSELKHTQKLIKTKMTGTRSSLSQLDGDEPADAGSLNESVETITQEMDAMQKAQDNIIKQSQSRNTKAVKSAVMSANNMYKAEANEIQANTFT